MKPAKLRGFKFSAKLVWVFQAVNTLGKIFLHERFRKRCKRLLNKSLATLNCIRKDQQG